MQKLLKLHYELYARGGQKKDSQKVSGENLFFSKGIPNQDISYSSYVVIHTTMIRIKISSTQPRQTDIIYVFLGKWGGKAWFINFIIWNTPQLLALQPPVIGWLVDYT